VFNFNNQFDFCTCGDQPQYFLAYTAPVTGLYHFDASTTGFELNMQFFNSFCSTNFFSTCSNGFPDASLDQSLEQGQTITVVLSPICSQQSEGGILTVDLIE
jgi:hypothetical protein